MKVSLLIRALEKLGELAWILLGQFGQTLRQNSGTGLLALALSSALWVIITTQENPPQTGLFPGRVPVQPVNVPPGLDVLGKIEPVTVRLTTPRDLWPGLTESTFNATVDLSGLRVGDHEVQVRVKSKDSRALVLNVFPQRVTVRLEALKKQALPVKVNIKQPPPFGYTYQFPKTSLDQVMVAGPEQLVALVESAEADVNLGEARTSLKQSFRLIPRTDRGYDVEGVTLDPPNVAVEVSIIREISYQSLAIVPDMRGAPASGYLVRGMTVQPPSVIVFGPSDVLTTLSYLKTRPIDISNVTSSTTRSVALDLPPGVSVVGKETVQLDLTITPVKGSAVFMVAPRFESLPQGRRFSTETNSLEVTVSGEVNLLRELTSEKINITVNLRNLSLGYHRVEPEIKLPQGIKLEKLSPDKISVNIQ